MIPKKYTRIEIIDSGKRTLQCHTVMGPMRLEKSGRLLLLDSIDANPEFTDFVMLLSLSRTYPENFHRLLHLATDCESYVAADCTTKRSCIVWYLHSGPKMYPGIMQQMTSADEAYVNCAITQYLAKEFE